jgi:Fur family ferric uptake transcriptional regulator
MERDTQQRRAIRQVFVEIDRPMTPTEVLESAKRYVATMGMATVYRNLKLLTGEGWLSSVELPGEPDRYERAGKGHHHHFICTSCEQAFDVEACATDVRSMVPRGFEVTSHHMTLYGACADCSGVTQGGP